MFFQYLHFILQIPPQDIDSWLRWHCTVLQETPQKVDEKGYRSSEYRAIIQLERGTDKGGYRHVPKYFFLGAERPASGVLYLRLMGAHAGEVFG